jgi:eukaryotic-like serine/threonine-protein kinase
MSQNHDQLETLFNAALGLSPPEREAYLAHACGGDAQLRQRVERLLRALDQAGGFLTAGEKFNAASGPAAHGDLTGEGVPPSQSDAAGDPTVLAPITEQPGDRIGRYKLLQRIGEGGCGVVYMADQEEPVRRRVALKVIKLGMDTKQVIARFEAERQALALMDHPNIAKVLDAGATDTGRPYFVMELVRGVRITEYCDQNRLSTDDRLKLFIQVCHAVQHAHQKGVIHRDIKPSNILVMVADDVPMPKMIDFGIAKAIGERLTDKTVFTRFEQFIGTPAYMSPEQAGMSGLDVDTRSDIYALGVLLYELLTGRPPFEPKELAQAGLDEIIRRIREEEPPKPSTRLSRLEEKERTTTAQRRSTEAPKLIRSLRGDLDWVVMKCLEKNRTRRYETAGCLAQEIERHLKQEPILARPPSTAYRAQKFIRRNKVMVTAAAILICLVVLTTAGAWFWLRHTHIEWAKNQAVTEMERLTEQASQGGGYSKFRQALQLGQRASRYAPTDPRLKKALDACSSVWSIESDPPGAQVSIRPYDDTNETWKALGHTPILNRFGRGFYVVRLEKAGYDTVEAVGGAMIGEGDVSRQLDPAHTIPPGMIRVPGRRVASLGDVEVPSFFVDKYEVTNRRFKEFVHAGGYQNSRYWKQPFVRDGKVLTWEEAMSLFRDTTGRPGPASWVSGNYPAECAEHPVSGVSWYEAAAYAGFAGKSLPTKDHWAAAAGFDLTACQWYFPSLISAASNFHLDRTAPVGSHKGINRFGAFDMAGNVREWCSNESADGRFIRGGAWDSPPYMYSLETQQALWDRSPQNGFRCVKYLDRDRIPAKLFERSLGNVRDFRQVQPVSDDVFEIYKAKFQYDRTELKSNVEEYDESAADWIRERATFDAAYNSERMIAQLYLPRNGRKPYQSLMFIGGPVLGETRATMEWLLTSQHFDCLLKSGRAVVFPVIKGTYERTGDMTYPKMFATEEYRHTHTEILIKWVQDFGRCIDYLQRRPDFDGQKIALCGASWSGDLALIVSAVEPRVRANIIFTSGFPDNQALPEAQALNYVSRVKVPTLMLNGRYDMFYPLDTAVKPAFNLLGTPEGNKELKVYDTDHYIPLSEGSRQMLAWLDKYFGPQK